MAGVCGAMDGAPQGGGGGDSLKLTAISATCAGASHVRNGKICQDASDSASGGGFAFAAVADGHVGDEYIRSDKGA